MSETDKMIEAAEERLSTARLLLENDRYMDTVSRAYYSIFHAAKALLKTESHLPGPIRVSRVNLGNCSGTV